MKKHFVLNFASIIAISSPILIASSCDNTTKDDYFEKRAKETDEEIEKRYINEYIQKENYIFDDFEQFKFNKEKHFRKNVDPNVLTLKETSKDNFPLIQDFEIWHNDFIRHYNIFKKVITMYAPDKRANYINASAYQYFVKEIIFDFNANNRIDANWYLLIYWTDKFWLMLNKILELPNLNLNIALPEFPMSKLVNPRLLYSGRYLSKNYAWTKDDYEALMLLVFNPKPKLLPEINDENNKYKDVPANISFKAGHANDVDNTPYTPWDYSAASYEQFYKTFLDYDDKKLQELTKRSMCNFDPIKFHSPIVEIVKYKDQLIKETYTHYRFRAEKGNEDIKIFKWAGKVPKN